MVSFLLYLKNIDELRSIINTKCLTISTKSLVEVDDTAVYLCLDESKCLCGSAKVESVSIEEEEKVMKFSNVSLCHIEYEMLQTIPLKSSIEKLDNKYVTELKNVIDEDSETIVELDESFSEKLNTIVQDTPEVTIDNLIQLCTPIDNTGTKPTHMDLEQNESANVGNTDGDADIPPSKSRKLSESDDVSSKSATADEAKVDDVPESALSNPLMAQFSANCIHKLSPFWGGDGKPPAYLNELADYSYEEYQVRFENACKKRYKELLKAQSEKIEKAKADGLPMPISAPPMPTEMPYVPPRNMMPSVGSYMNNSFPPPHAHMMHHSQPPFWGNSGGGRGGPPVGGGFYPTMQQQHQPPPGTW